MRVQDLVPSLIAVSLLAAAASGAAPTEPREPMTPPDFVTPDRLAHAQGLADELVHASPADALRLVAQEGGHRVASTAELPDPVDALQRAGIDPLDLPDDLVLPVGRLMGAIQTAETLRAEAVAGLTSDETTLVLSGDLFAQDAKVPDRPEGASATLVTYTDRYSAAERDAIAAKVDMDKLVTAAAVILDAIRETTPMLPSVAANGDGGAGAGCTDGPPSIFDEPGKLAIDDSDKRWTSDYTLILDLGGNDCHENTAASGTGGIEVLIDVQGDDLYRESSTSGAATGIGYGANGVGVLVDMLGDDVYVLGSVRAAPQPGPVAGTAAVTGQGAGVLGVGVLVDTGGRDALSATATSSGGPASVAAQGGAGSLGGVGLLVAGTGTSGGQTSYVADAKSTLHLVSRTPSQSTYAIGRGVVTAQGGGAGGVGGLVDAAGDDRYRSSSFGSEGLTVAQGAGSAGVGVLVDGAGNDAYDARAEGDVTLSLIVTDTNFCWTTTVNTSSGLTSTVAQGAATTGGGILADLSTDGTNGFTATARSHSGSHSEVRLSASTFCTNSAHATASTGTARVNAQGMAASGAGVLLGGGSADTYTVTTGSTALARALVNHGQVGANTASAASGSAETLSHGYASVGAGILADVGGNDAYRHGGATSATERTTVGGTVPGTSGTVSLIGEGWAASGLGWLLDLGGTDAYSTPDAANDHCWTQPTSGTGNLDHGRGRDLQAPFAPPPASCP